MKLQTLQGKNLNEDLKRAKNEIKDALDLIRDVRSNVDGDDKKKLQQAVEKLQIARDEVPNSDFSYFKKLIGKLLTLPFKFFMI